MSNCIKYCFLNDANCTSINGYTDPWYKSLYVRYHPFQFINEPYVIVVDGSMSITKGIDDLATKFIEGDYDVGLLLSHEPEIFSRIGRWLYNGRISNEEAAYLTNLVKPFDAMNYKGTIAGAVRLFHNTDAARKYLDICWNDITSYVHPVRLDEVPSTLALEKVDDIKIMPMSTGLIQGDAFIYNNHKNNCIRKLNYDKESFWIKNKKVVPVSIGNAYHRLYTHKSEAMCLTRFFTENELRFWLDHHLTLGFDHIHIFDNESLYPCKAICDEYGDRVSYEFIQGNARHYKIFDDYINSDRCKSEWIIPIDDDEFLSLNPDICTNVNELIDWYLTQFPNTQMFAIRWKHLFPKKFHTECTGNILEYCTEENSALARAFQPMGDLGIKTFVRRCGYVHYEETEENPHGGHVPSHRLANGARFYTGDIISRCSCRSFPTLPGEPARLIHCRYKGYTWYKQKMENITKNKLCLDNTSGIIYTKRYKFDSMLEDLD